MIEGKFLVFSCQNRKYAIELTRILEVKPAENILPVPTSSPHLIGIYNLRGKILKIKDLGSTLSNKKSSRNEQSVLIYLESNVEKIAVMVDALLAICSSKDVQWPSNQHIEPEHSLVIDYFTWNEEIIQVLSIDRIAS